MLDLSYARTNIKLSDVAPGQFFCLCDDDPVLTDVPRHEYTNQAGKKVDVSSIFMMIGIPGYLKVKHVTLPNDSEPISKKQFKKYVCYINIHTANMHCCNGDEYVYVVPGIDFTVSV